MKLVDRNGNLVDVADEQVPQAFASGQFGFQQGAPVKTVSPDGQVGTVKPEDMGAFLAGGGRVASEGEYRSAELEAKHGGVGGSLAALGEGAARGLTLGLSDPLAVGAARLIGGDKTAEDVRQHLAEEKEAHPWLSIGGELAGAAAPILLSGGTAAPVEGAEAAEAGLGLARALGTGAGALGETSEAGAIARIADGVRSIGVLPRTIGAAGDVAEGAVSSLLGASAETAIGRAGQAAARAAARGIVEGGLFGAGQEVSDATLQDRDLTAESLLASVGHGALLGGLLGLPAGAGGQLAKEGIGAALGKLGPSLDDAAAHQTWKWLDPPKRLSEEAERRAGGADAVGRTVFERVLRPLVERDGIAAAAMSPEAKLELVSKAVDATGKEIGQLVSDNAHAGVKLADMLAPIDQRIAEFSGKVGGEDKVASLEKLRQSVTRVLGAEPVTAPAVDAAEQLRMWPDRALRRVPLDMLQPPGEVWKPQALEELTGAMRAGRPTPPIKAELGAEEFRQDPEKLIFDDGIHRFNAGKQLGHSHANVLVPEEQAGRVDELIARRSEQRLVPISEAISQRRSLQQIAFEESKSLDPQLRVQLLRDVSREWGKLEEQALNAATKDAGDLAGQKLRALNKEFQQLRIAEDALDHNLSRYATNRNLSLSDYLMGAAHAPGMLLGGHPIAAAGAVASSVGHKMLRAHGNAYAALLLDRLATWGGVSRAAAEVDSQVDSAIQRFVSGGRRALRSLPAAATTRDTTARYKRERERVEQLAQVAPANVTAHLDDHLAPLATHAPQLAQALTAKTTKATAFLASKLPPKTSTSTLTPHLDTRPVSAPDRAKFLRYADALEGGPEGIAKRLAAHRLTREDVETLHEVYPRTFASIAAKVARACADRQRPLSYQQRIQAGMLFGMPTDATLKPDFVAAVQASYASHPDSEAKPPHANPQAKLGAADAERSLFAGAEGRAA